VAPPAHDRLKSAIPAPSCDFASTRAAIAPLVCKLPEAHIVAEALRHGPQMPRKLVLQIITPFRIAPPLSPTCVRFKKRLAVGPNRLSHCSVAAEKKKAASPKVRSHVEVPKRPVGVTDQRCEEVLDVSVSGVSPLKKIVAKLV
jgi:hypothetical protein